MSQMLKMEDCKELEIAHVTLFRKKLKNFKYQTEFLEAPIFPLSMRVIRETISQLDSFENPPKDSVLTCNISYATTVSDWAIVIESGLASIFAIYKACTEDNSPPSNKPRQFIPFCKFFINKSSPETLSTFNDILLNDLNALRNFRNSFLHSLIEDFYNNNEINKTSHSHLFAKNPFHATLLDVIEATRISTQFFTFFRYLIPSLDLMPAAPLTLNSSIVFEKLDRIYTNVILPTFLESLKKHNLSTDHCLKLKNLTPLPPLKMLPVPFFPIIKAQHTPSCFTLSSTTTHILRDRIEKLIGEKASTPDTITLPNFQTKLSI